MTFANYLSLIALVFAAGGAPSVFAQPAAASRLGSLPDQIRQYTADRDAVGSFYQLPASEVAWNRRQQLAADWLTRWEAIDFGALDPAERVDYVLLANHLQQSLDRIARERKQTAEIDSLLPFRAVIEALETARWRAVPLDCPAVASQLGDLARQVKQLREDVDKRHKAKPEAASRPEAASGGGQGPAQAAATPPPTPSQALRAGTLAKEFQETLKRWYGFYSGYQPEFDWWIKQPYDEAARQLDEYAKLLREEIAGQKGKSEDPLVGEPIGAEALAAAIRFEFLPYTAAELIAIGERELAWGETQMKAAAGQMGLGDDWQAALARVKANHVPPGGQDDLIAQIGREATEFVKQRKLLTVPPLAEETWRMTMISPQVLKTIPYAAYGGQQMLVAYAKDEMSQEDKRMVMRGNNRHFMRLVTPHELIPGHHLQNFYAARHSTYRQVFSTPFYSEGWALYWELRLWDLDWATTPEDRIGLLFWRMTRAARIIVSLKYHLGQMRPEEMVQFLQTRVGHEKLGATSEVRRFIRAEPLYQASYLVGGLQLAALHKELVVGRRMPEQEFHDAVLVQGTMPIELLRAALTAAPPARDAKPAWRFASPPPGVQGP